MKTSPDPSGMFRIYEDDQWVVSEIKTPAAARAVALGTIWCTARRSKFKYYRKTFGPLYIFEHKARRNARYQFSPGAMEFCNAFGEQFNWNEILQPGSPAAAWAERMFELRSIAGGFGDTDPSHCVLMTVSTPGGPCKLNVRAHAQSCDAYYGELLWAARMAEARGDMIASRLFRTCARISHMWLAETATVAYRHVEEWRDTVEFRQIASSTTEIYDDDLEARILDLRYLLDKEPLVAEVAIDCYIGAAMRIFATDRWLPSKRILRAMKLAEIIGDEVRLERCKETDAWLKSADALSMWRSSNSPRRC